MKKILKISLMIIGILICIILVDSFQAVLFNNNVLIGIESKCRKREGILVETYHCGNEKNISKFKSNTCNYENVCGEELKIEYLISLNDVNNLIIDYLSNNKMSNVVFNYVDNDINKVVVGLLDASYEKQNEFIFNVFTSCCGSDYIKYLNDHKLIEFRETDRNVNH